MQASRSFGRLLSALLVLSLHYSPTLVAAVPGQLDAASLRGLRKEFASVQADGEMGKEQQVGGGVASDPRQTVTFSPQCAWSFHTVAEDLSPIAPEPNVIYQLSILALRPNDTTVYRVRGRFPLVRYFSFQTYTIPSYQPIATVKDFSFVPKDGRNPFNDPGTTQAESGTYELFVTSSGKEGYPNEIRGAPKAEEMTTVDKVAGFKTSLLFMRLYAKDPVTRDLPKDDPNAEFGYVPPPIIEYRVGNQGPWVELKTCRRDVARSSSQTYNSILTTPQFYLPVRQFPINCPFANSSAVNSNFFLFKSGDNQLLDTYVGFKNQDTNYLCWCDFTRRISDEFVVVINGVLPLTPYGLFTDPKVANRRAYDSRYVSFHAVDFAPPIPSLSAVYDQDIIDYYTKNTRKWDGNYRIVGARNKQVASACGMLPKDGVFLSFTRTGNDIPEDANELAAPAIIYRDILPRVIELGEPGQSSTDVSRACKGAECRDPAFYKDIMGSHYPEITVYKCDTTTRVLTKLSG